MMFVVVHLIHAAFMKMMMFSTVRSFPRLVMLMLRIMVLALFGFLSHGVEYV